MARPSLKAITINKLEAMLQQQRNRKSELARKRRSVLKELARIDQEIAAVTGDGASAAVPSALTPSGRPRNAKSLAEYAEELMAKAGKGVTIDEIMDGVQGLGYATNSDNFRSIVNQMLIRETKKFKRLDRGVYSLTK